LVIEDNPGDVRLLQEMLAEARGTFVLESADRLSTGLERLAAGDVDVIILSGPHD
jgi:CheY-like chemotaxis protein